METIEKTARYLGYAGLIPFILGLVLLSLGADATLREFALQAVVAYAAVIFTFITAIHWGMVIHLDKDQLYHQLIIAIIPSLIAWCALLLPENNAVIILFFCYIAWHAYERTVYSRLQYPEWFRQLRSQLSYSVSGCLLLIWLLSLFNSQLSA